MRRPTSERGKGAKVPPRLAEVEFDLVLTSPRQHAAGLTEQVGQCVSAFGRAVDDEKCPDAGIQQGWCDRARSTTGADDQGAALAQVQPVAIGQVANQANTIGIVRMPDVVLSTYQRIGRAYAFGAIALA